MEQENSSGVLEGCVNPKMEEDWLDADSGDDEELSSDEEDRDEDKNSVKDDHFSDVSGLMKQEMVEKDEVPFLNVPAPELKVKEETDVKEKSTFSCDQCDYSTWSEHGLQIHKTKHERDLGYKCVDCEEIFVGLEVLHTHCIQNHGGIKCSEVSNLNIFEM